jgi:hypothetical protein
MDEEAWRQRLEQINGWYLKKIGPVNAGVRANTRADLARLEAQLADKAWLLKTPWPSDRSLYGSPDIWDDDAQLLRALKELPWVNQHVLAQDLAEITEGVPAADIPARIRLLWLKLYGASRAYRDHARAVRLEVPADLQCALLATEPPDDVVWADIALPAEGFILNVPYTEIEATKPEEFRAYGGVATHMFIVPIHPEGPKRGASTAVGLAMISPGAGLFIWGDADSRRRDVRTHGAVMLLCARYALNLLIYLKAGAASLVPRYAEEIAKIEAVPRKKRRKIQEERLKKLKTDTVFNVMTTLPLDPHIKDFVHAGGLATPTWTLKNRTLVRGHWRNQACGEERKERKLIPIAPHFRGPDLGAQIAATAHTYKVK